MLSKFFSCDLNQFLRIFKIEKKFPSLFIDKLIKRAYLAPKKWLSKLGTRWLRLMRQSDISIMCFTSRYFVLLVRLTREPRRSVIIWRKLSDNNFKFWVKNNILSLFIFECRMTFARSTETAQTMGKIESGLVVCGSIFSLWEELQTGKHNTEKVNKL